MNSQITTENFVEILVAAVTGLEYNTISEDVLPTLIPECIEIFSQYIYDYVEQKFGSKDAIRLKAIQMYDKSDDFAKFPDLEEKFLEACNAFVNQIELKK